VHLLSLNTRICGLIVQDGGPKPGRNRVFRHVGKSKRGFELHAEIVKVEHNETFHHASASVAQPGTWRVPFEKRSLSTAIVSLHQHHVNDDVLHSADSLA
jgi:hypothetical protein